MTCSTSDLNIKQQAQVQQLHHAAESMLQTAFLCQRTGSSCVEHESRLSMPLQAECIAPAHLFAQGNRLKELALRTCRNYLLSLSLLAGTSDITSDGTAQCSLSPCITHHHARHHHRPQQAPPAPPRCAPGWAPGAASAGGAGPARGQPHAPI